MINAENFIHSIPAKVYLFKVNTRKTRETCGVCLKLTITTPEWRHWRRSSVFNISFSTFHNFFWYFYYYFEQVKVKKFIEWFIIKVDILK